MPIPEPAPGESHEEFIGRCTGDSNMQEYDDAQRQAICERQWDEGGVATAGYSMPRSRVLAAIYATAWAILPAKLEVIVAVAERHAAGVRLSQAEIAAAVGSRPAERPSQGAIAVLPIFGTIVPRADLMSDTSGLTSAERLGTQFRALVRDPGIASIVLDVDSPGGAVQGIDELSQEIYRARVAKPIVAVANHLAASAAYWLATAADELVVTPSGEVGSIGVFAAHEDESAALAAEGRKVTLISAGKYKVEASPYAPLEDEARAAIQGRVDEYYDMFIKAVARNRGVKAAEVRDGFGEGRVVGARQALELGMADRIGTLQETLTRLQKAPRAEPGGRSAAEDLEFRRRRARRVGNL